MPDQFDKHVTALDSPAADAVAVTPSDSVNFTTNARALYVGNTGNVVLIPLGGTAVTFANVAAGTIIPVRCSRVNATGTTATNIVRLT